MGTHAERTTSTHQLTQKRRVGNHAENCAREHLIVQGMRFIDANYLCKLGEIDLIMKDRDTLVFVEVRYRESSSFGSPIESITYTKQKKVMRAAEHYLLRHKIPDHFCRFDAVGICGKGSQQQIEWVKDAFRADGW